ncbi:hypothetical protein [Marinobacter shengliensis]|uniref:WYL domain-containing protein n=1 Tax=Marinobacter shengliensis TaxID=1389223 RepID=A0ABV4WC58_9GAMM
MAVSFGWEHRRPAGLSQNFKNREMLWLWCQLEWKGYNLDATRVSDISSRANHIIDSILDADKETVDDLRRYESDCFSGRLDDEEFKWIDFNNRRLVSWVLGYINSGMLYVGTPTTNFDQSVLRSHERIKLAFDLSSLALNIKKDTMLHLRNNWSLLIGIDPSLDWVNRKDDEQCRWLVDQLQSGDFAPFISPEFQRPISNEDRVIMFFNAIDMSGFSLNIKRLYLKDLKSKWRRKQKKLDGRKVQCNLNVDSLTKENIKDISVRRKLKMGELIDALVAEEVARLKAEDDVL